MFVERNMIKKQLFNDYSAIFIVNNYEGFSFDLVDIPFISHFAAGLCKWIERIFTIP